MNVLVLQTFHPRRAVVYVPASDKRKIIKSQTLNADTIVLDCEDGVSINKKVRKFIHSITVKFVFQNSSVQFY